jgi:flagellar export protein FliJ
MKAFTFRLSALLTLKESKKDQALKRLASAIENVAETQKKLEESNQRYHQIIGLIENHQKTNFNVTQIKILQDSLQLEKSNLDKIQLKLNQHKDIEKSRRKLFLSKDSEFKALLRLKEKQQEQHFLNENKKERNELEDIIAARFLFHSNHSKL